MATREISPSDWGTFLEGLGKTHHGWIVDVETLDPELGAQLSAHKVTLDAVTFGGGREIELLLGDDAGGTLTRILKDTARVFLMQSPDGIHEALEVEQILGTKTILRFLAPSRPALTAHIA